MLSALASIFLNYGVWRESAGLEPLSKLWSNTNRETSYNWTWITFFSIVYAGSATDIYIHRHDSALSRREASFSLNSSDWIIVIAVVWSEVGVCVLAIMFNELFSGRWELFRCGTATSTFVFGWPQIEGLLILLAIGAKLWVILEYTGVNGVVNGLSNGYFGIWGSFFNSVFCLGTWIRENRKIDYTLRDDRTVNTRQRDGVSMKSRRT